ncbi:MAG: S24 family peptidase [Clostridiales bacterium]|nr:S24 family peptidase [Clostridiales bacterium]
MMGDLVYVRKQETVRIGEIGIFVMNNECYIKELGEYGLLSHNKEYGMIPGDESIQCVGKVLGKVLGK